VWRTEYALDIYKRRHDPTRPAVELDVKPVPPLGEFRRPRTYRPQRFARRDCDYRRVGRANTFCIRAAPGLTERGNDPPSDEARLRLFAKDLLDGRCHGAETFMLVMDQLNTHSPASPYATFEPAEAKRPTDRKSTATKQRSGVNVARSS
jgi:hypothetical protein